MKMNRVWLLCLLLGVAAALVKSANPHDAFVEDNDFAEFEEFDEEEEGKCVLFT